MPRVDPVTADKVRQVLTSARARGADAAIALDQAHLILYPRLERMIEVKFLERVMRDLEGLSADVLPEHRARLTKLDMKQYILALLGQLHEGLIRNADSAK